LRPPEIQGAAPGLALCASTEPDDYRHRDGPAHTPFRWECDQPERSSPARWCRYQS